MNRKPFAGTMLPAKSRVTQVVVMMVFAVVALSGAFANSNQTRQVTKSEFTTPAPSPTPPPQEWVELDIIAPQQTVEVTTRADHYTARFQHRAKVYPNGRANGMLELTTPRGELVRYDSFYGTGVYKSTDSGKTWLQVMLRLRRASAPRGDEITVMLRPAPSPSGPGATGNVYTVTFGGSLSGSFAANYQIKIRLRDTDGPSKPRANVDRQNSANSELTAATPTATPPAKEKTEKGGRERYHPLPKPVRVLDSRNAQTRTADKAAVSIPAPQLEFVGKEAYEVNGTKLIRYKLSVTHRASHPDFLWQPTPHLAPCGKNRNASRTWVEIFGSPGDQKLNSFCALRSSDDLGDLWFAEQAGEQAPPCVYIVMTDRETGKNYRSNRVCSRIFTATNRVKPDDNPDPAKDRFYRTKPHVNVAADGDVKRRSTVAERVAVPAREKMPTADAPATEDLATGQQPTLDRKAFEDSLHAAVAPNVMGYTFLLIKDGRVVTEGAGGLARNAADGEMKMTTSTPQNMGSLFKFITGVTVLHLLDRAPAGSAGGNNSFQTRLDAPVKLLYPQLWNAGIKTPTIRNITFRHLLQHRSGFRGCSTPLGCFGKPYNTTLLGVRKYENINFQLLGFLIPLYTNPELNQGLNAVAKTVPEDEGDHHIQMVLSDRMDRFLHQTMFPLAPGKISASCDAENEYRATGAYGYVSKSDTGKGIITSRKAGGKPCVGSGGYWMSIRDFGAFVAAALHSDRMLSQQARLEMYRTGMPADDRLVWSFTTSDPWISDKFKMSTIIWSNGIQPYDGGQSFNTVLLRLPLNYELMVFVNSGGMSVNSLASAGLKAFRAGMEP